MDRELAIAFVEQGWGESRDSAAVRQAFDYAGYINFVRLERTTWDDLSSTGNLDLLSQDLRQSLGQYYRSTRFLDEFDDQRKDRIWFHYRPALGLHLFAAGPGLPDFDGLRTDPEIRAALPDALGMARIYRTGIEVIEGRNRELLSRIRELRR